MMFKALTAEEYDQGRKQYRDYITEALDYADPEDPLYSSISEIEADITRGVIIPISIYDRAMLVGLFTVQIHGESLHVTTMSGALKKGWRAEVYNILVDLAKSQGRKNIQIAGRIGWRRYLKHLGFKQDGPFLRAEI